MKIVVVYLRIYGACLANAGAALAKNAWTIILPMMLMVAFQVLAQLLGGTGMFGGLILALVRSVGFGVYTYFVSEVVAKNRVNLTDFKSSIGPFFWTWMNLFFVFWIIDILLGAGAAANPNRQALFNVVTVMEVVVFNAAPEVIYVKRTYGGLDTMRRSFAFLQENWIEWFIPNGLLIAAVYLFVSEGGLALVAGIPFGVYGLALVAGALFHFVMVFRGFLFEALDGSSHRQRMFRYRA
jgi:hypothetical protein